MRQLDISQGIDPVRASYDITEDAWYFRVGKTSYRWHSKDLPFTVMDGPEGKYADESLVLKHGAAQREMTRNTGCI